MKDILAITTDSFCSGSASTIERVTMQAARQLATRSDPQEPRRSGEDRILADRSTGRGLAGDCCADTTS
jgi:hypothetical protein